MRLNNKQYLNLFFVSLLAVVSWSCKDNAFVPKADINVVVSPAQKLDFPFLGHGVQWSAYPHADAPSAEWGALMTDEKWEILYERLDYINPRIIRVMDVATWRYYEGLDEQGQPQINFDTPEIKSLYKLLDYCQKRAIPVLFGEWGAPGLWNLDDAVPEIERADDPRWIQMIVSYLDHLINVKGYTCIQYYNLVNEPNGYWASTDGDWEQWKKGYQMLFDALQASNLADKVQMAGPDAVTQWDHPTNPKKAHDWVYNTITHLDKQTGLYDFHIYANQDMIRTGDFTAYLKPFMQKIKPTQKPFVLGELGMKYTGELFDENKKRGEEDPFAGPDDSSMFVYDYFYGVDMADAAVQAMLAGAGGAIAWDLDDAMHTVGDLGEKHQLKKWGMWNILAEEFGDNPVDRMPRPWAYPWSLLCQLYPPKSTVYKPQLDVVKDSIRAVAAQFDNGFTLTLVNQSKEDQHIAFSTTLLDQKQDLYVYEYAEEFRKKNLAGFPIPAQKIKSRNQATFLSSIALKKHSVLFVSTKALK